MIPSVAHFIWLGREFPWVHALAIRSCAERGGFARVVLHCSDDLSASPWWPEVAALPGFDVRPIEVRRVFGAVDDHGPALLSLYHRLRQPAARANVLRAAILAVQGGVYLDIDTVTMGSFNRLRARGGVFFGEEHLVLPVATRHSLRPDVQLATAVRMGVRELCRRRPGGWRTFRKLQRFYPRAANNAVLASEPGHRFMRELLHRMVTLPPGRQQVRYALGTHLLQQAMAACEDPTVRVLPPPVFYPVAPEISEHWFRADGTARAADLLQPESLVVHWYASVRTKNIVPTLTPEHVRTLAPRQAFSELALPFTTPAAARRAD
jgi:Glycosyltransferase sugar-binding region containing DXD motif